MPVTAFDHAALPTADSERFLAFYKALGFGIEGEDAWRAGTMPIFSITFGNNKINVHTEELFARSKDIPGFLRGPTAEPGCGDFCFVWAGSSTELTDKLRQAGAVIEVGPVERIGGRDAGRAKGTSLYTRDPDGNLLEFIRYESAA